MAERHEKLRKSLALMLSLSCTRSGVTLRELMATHDLGIRTLQRMLRAIEQVSGPLEEVPSGGREKRWRLRPTPLAQALARGRAIRCALNQTLCEESALLSDGAEVAFFPPVTGG